MWKVYVRPDGRADFLPDDVPTPHRVERDCLSLAEAIGLADRLNAERLRRIVAKADPVKTQGS